MDSTLTLIEINNIANKDRDMAWDYDTLKRTYPYLVV